MWDRCGIQRWGSMKSWWEVADAPLPAVQKQCAVAYYRHSAQDRQENSIPLQREQVCQWAEQNGVQIIREFADHGKSGLTAEGRPAFGEMMEVWVKQREDFEYVLCLDVSRWGRFQDIDLSAQYSAECKKHGKQVIYTTIGKPREDDPLYPVYVQFERFRAAQYSRELSDKVKRGCRKIAEQGYWAGGQPPYGLRRVLLDERREPVQTLAPGQRKGIQNQRVTLAEGPAEEVATIQRIFHEFVMLGYSEFRIAEGLNYDEIPSPGGSRWGAASVLTRLRNEKYVGTMVYDQSTQKLKSPRHRNPPEKWVRTPEAFEGIVHRDDFEQAQLILESRKQRYAPDTLLRQLQMLHEQYGLVSSSLLRLDEKMPRPATYARHFGSLDFAFQMLFAKEREQAREMVHKQICAHVPQVLSYADFLVLDRRLTLSIQPAVPIPHADGLYWPLRMDARPVIDITLGVLLSAPDDFEILGYIALPRWLAGTHPFRLTGSSARTDMFGRRDLTFLKQLL